MLKHLRKWFEASELWTHIVRIQRRHNANGQNMTTEEARDDDNEHGWRSEKEKTAEHTKEQGMQKNTLKVVTLMILSQIVVED